MNRVTIVEDDITIAQKVKQNLEKSGISATYIKDFNNIITEIEDYKPDLIVMDIFLPVEDGYFWTRKIREFTKIPIVFLSSAEEKMNTIKAIEAGADDFIVKPFSMDVLIAKIQSWLRRTYNFDKTHSVLSFKNYQINLIDSQIIYDDQSLDISGNEQVILKQLFENQNNLVTKQDIISALWNNSNFIDENTLQVTMTRLRKKLDTIQLSNYIETVRGKGYRLTDSYENN
ncbi:response regulator transcription factor [Companilactobacillus metriopterae]|uniref:response regulator transcription factor n=1 Tax=Companilactobacillus metriopterae TaxID=1909267 RepID=UPI00100AB340|nr:response regulator transcription factor [Companilactobacillus metriopterae]